MYDMLSCVRLSRANRMPIRNPYNRNKLSKGIRRVRASSASANARFASNSQRRSLLLYCLSRATRLDFGRQLKLEPRTLRSHVPLGPGQAVLSAAFTLVEWHIQFDTRFALLRPTPCYTSPRIAAVAGTSRKDHHGRSQVSAARETAPGH